MDIEASGSRELLKSDPLPPLVWSSCQLPRLQYRYLHIELQLSEAYLRSGLRLTRSREGSHIEDNMLTIRMHLLQREKFENQTSTPRSAERILVVDASVTDRQNSRVAQGPVKFRPSAAFLLGALARLQKSQNFACFVFLINVFNTRHLLESHASVSVVVRSLRPSVCSGSS